MTNSTSAATNVPVILYKHQAYPYQNPYIQPFIGWLAKDSPVEFRTEVIKSNLGQEKVNLLKGDLDRLRGEMGRIPDNKNNGNKPQFPNPNDEYLNNTGRKRTSTDDRSGSKRKPSERWYIPNTVIPHSSGKITNGDNPETQKYNKRGHIPTNTFRRGSSWYKPEGLKLSDELFSMFKTTGQTSSLEKKDRHTVSAGKTNLDLQTVYVPFVSTTAVNKKPKSMLIHIMSLPDDAQGRLENVADQLLKLRRQLPTGTVNRTARNDASYTLLDAYFAFKVAEETQKLLPARGDTDDIKQKKEIELKQMYKRKKDIIKKIANNTKGNSTERFVSEMSFTKENLNEIRNYLTNHNAIIFDKRALQIGNYINSENQPQTISWGNALETLDRTIMKGQQRSVM